MVEMSMYSHQWTLGLANYKGKALTTGCNDFNECSFKTELLDMETLRVDFKFLLRWQTLQYVNIEFYSLKFDFQ